jgi:hypothetical protein
MRRAVGEQASALQVPGVAVFNPLDYSGIPLERQTRDWRELHVSPIDPEVVDPYTRCRIVAINGVENEAVQFDLRAGRATEDPDVRGELAYLCDLEAQQHRVVGQLLPDADCVLEAAVEYEEANVDLDSWLARMEPDRRRQVVYEADALEDFDHVYRYAEVLDMVRRTRAERVIDEVEEVLPDRPAARGRRHRRDRGREPARATPLSRLHALTMLAAEQQVVDFYRNTDPEFVDPVSRPLYRAISGVEQEEARHHEKLLERRESLWEQLLTHEYNECYLYYSFLQQEEDPRVRAVWELHLEMELAHLQAARNLLRQLDNREPEEVVGEGGVPEPLSFEENRSFLRRLLASRIDPNELGSGQVREAHRRFERMQEARRA